ncbi:hypothetical protein HNY73_016342 [Argiope bruennichi]|uniref:Uncharacterized protein n=1 Tax=Argiope bruennichi TaxID=94029 RepID=A0A8T0EIH8_ARGBR|nr:hypothetical protein HNY73_016342 [Argiope bruennichi]
MNNLVDDLKKDLKLNAEHNGKKGQDHVLQGALTTNFANGRATFSNISFLQTGTSFKLSVSSSGSPDITPWTSDSITVTEGSYFCDPLVGGFPSTPEKTTFYRLLPVLSSTMVLIIPR